MKKLLAIFALLASFLSARAELSVEWIDGNTIRVSGDGYTVVTNNVYTNCLGSCTNCVQISPDQMHEYKTSIISECDSVFSDLDTLEFGLQGIADQCTIFIDDIATFRRFTTKPSSGTLTLSNPDVIAFTNYVKTTSNTQTALDNQYYPNGLSGLTAGYIISYNNGIYDYANDYVRPLLLNDVYSPAVALIGNVRSARVSVGTIRNIVGDMSEEACHGCSGGGDGGGDGGDGGDGGGSCGDCPCVEQLDAIKDYVEHIDDDFHVQLQNMSDVTNFIPRMDSYAKLVSGILYNDATIVVDDGENSWSNVYRRGHSDLYDYDKSNILQRIELLLFGLTPTSTATNWGEVADIDSDSVNVQQQINDVGKTISEGHDGLSEDVKTIRGKISTLFDTLNFFGSSNMGTFTLNDPFRVFDLYEVEGIEPNGIDSLESFRNLIRSCFQVVYWVSGIAFMIAFWYFVVSFVVRRVFGFLKFFNNLLT